MEKSETGKRVSFGPAIEPGSRYFRLDENRMRVFGPEDEMPTDLKEIKPADAWSEFFPGRVAPPVAKVSDRWKE